MSASTGFGHAGKKAMCEKYRFCCKSLFALVIKISFGVHATFV
jgi:hypothetical protein